MGTDHYIGEISMVGFNFAPVGWALCDGQILPISSNTALFSLIGTTYGGDGRTTFALPDLRGRAPLHAGTGPGLTDRVWGESFGEETVTLTQNEMPKHTHGILAADDDSNTSNPEGALLSRVQVYKSGGTAALPLASTTCGTTGGDLPHENMQPSLVINFIIALTGIFPSRS
jgi:microcystin-dependent protein